MIDEFAEDQRHRPRQAPDDAASTDIPLTSTEAAQLLGLPHDHVVRLCRDGRIDSYTIRNILCIPADEVIRLLWERSRGKSRTRGTPAADPRHLRG
jgi:excisionase family DNA binding protein